MSVYLEIPRWSEKMAFRTFVNDGTVATYPHWHKEIEIIQGLKGVTKIGVADEIIELSAGEIHFFSSGEPHYFLPSANSLRSVFQFDLNLFDLQLLNMSASELVLIFEDKVRYSHHWPQATEKKLNDLLADIFISWQKESSNLPTVALLYQLLWFFKQQLPVTEDRPVLQKNFSKGRYKDTIQQLNKVYDYIENHYYETITLPDVADEVGFNPQYFTRFFKENTGTTFITFLNEYRLMKASFLLSEEKKPMADVAEMSGFSSTKNFQHTFKEHFGVSPLKYRKQLEDLE
ncbi:AraC family transcriptional regulator [Enterococcus timonensis]|uniref:AraC family transcriptional regulator n=1 Tax=Enterococcus timonensis TaxID=1852364 RepID=UPI0008DA733B|nr:AraC family transcriptional regulator [Enterococcus timonensis]